MKRRLDCAWCGRALPAGCRIDKRYCDQRCVELAYYDRHPDKRAQKLAKLRGTRTTAGLRTRRPASAPELVERMEAAHVSTRQELGALRERLTQMEALLRSQSRATKEAGPSPSAVQDVAAVRKVAELQQTLQVERERAEQAERENAALEERIEELAQQLRERHRDGDGSRRELAVAREAEHKAVQRSRELEVALKQAQAGTTRPLPASPESNALLPAARKQIADLEAKLQAAAQQASMAQRTQEEEERELSELRPAVENWRTRAETRARQLSEAQAALRTAEQRAVKVEEQATQKSSPRLPWTIPSRDSAHRFIPRWELWNADEFDNIGELTEEAVAAVPGQLWKGGDRKLSQEMREWLERPSQTLRRISQQMYLRILCTPPAERRSDKQKEVLGQAALADSIAYLRGRRPELTADLERDVEKGRENYEFFAEELVIACTGRKLKTYS